MDELIDVHGVLPVEDVPEALPAHVDPAGELGHADAAVLSGALYPRDYAIGLVHPSPCSELAPGIWRRGANPWRFSNRRKPYQFSCYVWGKGPTIGRVVPILGTHEGNERM